MSNELKFYRLLQPKSNHQTHTNLNQRFPGAMKSVYQIERDRTVPWKTWTACQDAITAAFRFAPVAGTLNIGLPSEIELPLCGNPKFRQFAASLLMVFAPVIG